MKLISFCIPSYNSQDYMRHCIDSLLIGGEDVEIIIVNDGSKDDTGKIAMEYQEKYPTIVKAVNKENGGHGSGVNKGMELATGLYFKVVDSDDWADEKGYRILLDNICDRIKEDNLPDLYLMDFLYNRPSAHDSYRRKWDFQFKAYQVNHWDKVKKFGTGKMFLMHALFYKTDVLRKSGMKLPEHTFYVDNIFAYTPLPYVKSIYYIPEVFYIYFIGREGQSVALPNIVKRYQQQIRVMKEMFDAHTYEDIKNMQKGLRHYMLHALNSMMVVTMMFTCGQNTPERKQDLKNFWAYCKGKDKELYDALRHRGYSLVFNHIPFGLRGKLLLLGYKSECRRHKLG